MTDGEFSSWNFMAEGRIQEELISLPKFSILQVNNYVSQRLLTWFFLNPYRGHLWAPCFAIQSYAHLSRGHWNVTRDGEFCTSNTRGQKRQACAIRFLQHMTEIHCKKWTIFMPMSQGAMTPVQEQGTPVQEERPPVLKRKVSHRQNLLVACPQCNIKFPSDEKMMQHLENIHTTWVLSSISICDNDDDSRLWKV